MLLLLTVASLAVLPASKAGGRAEKEAPAPLTVAVASNALRPIMEVVEAYRGAGHGEVSLVHGSTGKLYTQIIQGAPFHIFLAADAVRPRLIEERGMASAGTRFTYVRGVLALYTSRKGTGIEDKGLALLTGEDVLRVAIANPDTAPYGRAATRALARYGIMDDVETKLVYGENVSQAFSFARTGNADFAHRSPLDDLRSGRRRRYTCIGLGPLRPGRAGGGYH